MRYYSRLVRCVHIIIIIISEKEENKTQRWIRIATAAFQTLSSRFHFTFFVLLFRLNQTILLIVWLRDLFFPGRFQLLRCVVFIEQKTQLIFTLLGFAFIELISRWIGKLNRINSIEWTERARAREREKATRNCNLRYLRRNSGWLVAFSKFMRAFPSWFVSLLKRR